ncbi:hypothetical protein MCHIJ_23040 [Mycolicibacterium chitae]|uniref:13E12 repeat family protein n=1 Tax=Mycolicibacterium chitae TaxID=1792 RepID=A0A3S4VER0_MYCCI|nr:HNH endonuclease signature motif containing protein [Mycolicibacterium chitae]MCV7105618.1 DUF222 domain-containing protein [Mycolicibacterium chitae]BBZ02867.1 hypothetical protein MCHIJ_23040 [Mycolicibacterium chitae]VEG45843.1 13E12 repeat family protein [Mycolicibacterium chitae]
MFESSSPDELVAVVEDTRRAESANHARRTGAIAALLWERTAEAEGHDPTDPGYALITGFSRTCAEVGAAMNITPHLARQLVGHAEALDTRLPRIHALLADGKISWSDATAISTGTDYVEADLMPTVDAELAEKISTWDCWSRRRLLNTIDTTVHDADPEAAKERRKTADTDRRVTLKTQPNGMARIDGKLTAPAAVLFDQRLTAMARGVCSEDPRTLDQRRADAMAALGEGHATLACACENTDCPTRTTQAAGPATGRVVINVIASAETLTGTSEAPGYLDGYGVIDAAQVRDLADAGALLRPTTRPEPHAGADELLRHQPSAAATRWVRCRSLTCSFPGCNRSAWRADLDHTVPFDHRHPFGGGWTLTGNLDPKCREHHRLKTFHTGPDGWRNKQHHDGTIEWTSPTGRVYRSTPDGAELFPDIAACAAPAPLPRNRHAEKTRRTLLARAGMAAKRATNIETQQLNHARAQEIDLRQWRNEVRRRLHLLKGTPSTSPYCTWVNDPPEDPTITADWRPPPQTPTTDPDEPPF